MKQPLYKIVFLVIIIGFSSCKKLDYNNGFSTFADIFFLNNSINKNLAAKYNGSPITWDQGSGKIHTLEGEGTFEFYDKNSKVSFGTKKVNVTASAPQKIMLFQPIEDAPIAFLDPNAQEEEAPPKQGFMKIKLANYAANLLPFDKIDVVVYALVGRTFVKVGVIENVGKNLDSEEYHQVSIGEITPGRVPTYQFSFMNHATQEEVKNNAGTRYMSPSFNAADTKGIYTIYLTPFDAPEIDFFLKYNGKYYSVFPNILFPN